MDKVLVWLRRDLRCSDHAAFSQALRAARRVACAFVFDRAILDPIRQAGVTRDRRVDFIHQSASRLDGSLRQAGGGLRVAHGDAVAEIVRMADELGADAVFANHDTEPYAIERDRRAAQALAQQGRRLVTFKDQVVFERDEVMTGAGRPFSVFTPYRNA